MVALALLRAYKILLSPFFTGSCRFLPSCSDFAREAVIRYGVVRGCWLAARRLARCHPLGAAGYDPVPSVVHSRFPCASQDPRETSGGNQVREQ